MAGLGRVTDRLTSAVLYTGVVILIIWPGTALVNFSLDSKFYRDFLTRWEVALISNRHEGGEWPLFSGGSHVRYMEQLSRMMCSRGFPPPESNTARSYIYRLDKIGEPGEDIFLLCFSQKIILYGIPSRTFARIDAYIDGTVDSKTGAFTGQQSKDGFTFIGQWMI